MPAINYKIREVSPYINWIYFFHAWGFQPRFAAIANVHGYDSCRAMWLASFPQEDRVKVAEAIQLFKETNRILSRLDEGITVQCIYRLCHTNTEDDNLIIEGMLFPLLRRQTPNPDGNPFLCLSDFIRPLSPGIADTIGLFASSISPEAEEYYRGDPYKRLLAQTLSNRLAEAATEKVHEYVRRVAWGYASDESFSVPDLLIKKYQDIHPAMGYPSPPDQSVNFILNELLDMEQIGITLTENGTIHPHASVCGFVSSHPRSRYFAVGRIDEGQLEDYARRHGRLIGGMRKFLAASLRQCDFSIFAATYKIKGDSRNNTQWKV